MKENKVRQPRRSIAKGIIPKRKRGLKPRRAVAKGDVVIPKKGVWAGEECLVLDVEKRPQPSGYNQIVRVLLPNQRQRQYQLMEIKEIIPGKGANLTKARQQKSDAKVPNEKLNMEVTLEPLSGTAQDNLERARLEIERALGFRGHVSEAKVKGNRIVIDFEPNPKWDFPESEKVSYLKEWIPAKVRRVFEVVSISEGGNK